MGGGGKGLGKGKAKGKDQSKDGKEDDSEFACDGGEHDSSTEDGAAADSVTKKPKPSAKKRIRAKAKQAPDSEKAQKAHKVQKVEVGADEHEVDPSHEKVPIERISNKVGGR